MIRNIWNLPNITHKYFLEDISESPHIKSIFFQRFLSFINSIRISKKKCLSALAQFACKDQGSVTCQNLNLISKESGIQNVLEMNPRAVSQNICYAPVPDQDRWKVGFLKELLHLRQGHLELEANEFTLDEINTLIKEVATN